MEGERGSPQGQRQEDTTSFPSSKLLPVSVSPISLGVYEEVSIAALGGVALLGLSRCVHSPSAKA